MDLRTRTKIRWIKFYSADLPHKSLSNKDLLIINGGLLDPSKIQHALLLENSDGFFCSLMFKNPSEILFCKIRRKIQHALLLENPAFFLFPLCSRFRRKTCSSNFIVFCFQRPLKMMHHMNQALSLFSMNKGLHQLSAQSWQQDATSPWSQRFKNSRWQTSTIQKTPYHTVT